MHDKSVQSKYVTADELLAQGPCWLHYAYLVVSAASTDSALYDGTNTSGRKITDLVSAAVTGHEFRPAKPAYCSRGLYVDVGTNVSGIFVEWELDDSRPPAAPAKPPGEPEG